jgi:hypothetical protein
MARLEANLTIKTGQNKDYLCEMTEQYSDIHRTQEIVDNGDEYTTLASFGTAASISGSAGLRLSGSKLVIVKNNSSVPVELKFSTTDWLDSSDIDITNSVDLGPDSATNVRQFSYILAGDEYMILPSQWMVSYAEAHSAGNAKTVDNQLGIGVNSNKMYSAAVTDIATALENTADTLVVDDTDFFRAGDLIQVGSTTGTTATNIEIMRVTSITNTTTMEVERGMYGSIIADKDSQTDATNGVVVNAKVYFPFFNTQENYDKYHISADATGSIHTNKSGRYTSTNLFGYGRTATSTSPTGIVKGSFAMKFYQQGYQEFGLSGITPSTHSGLAASTAYALNITLDGGSTFESLSFTTDASNLNFGGNNGIIAKIQEALDTQYYTAGNLFEKKVIVGIVGGDVRFTSGQRNKGGKVVLASPTSGTTPFGVGRIPAAASLEDTVLASLPDDTVFDKRDYLEKKNKSVFSYDDGKGNIIGGEATGTINYETGALDFTGPPECEFAVTFNYDSAHSGGVTTTNILRTISARSLNSKIDAEVEVIGFV